MLTPVMIAQAKASGLVLVENNSLVEARLGKKVVAFHTDPAKALSKAKERIEEDRLRKVDKRPQDREPVLKAVKKSPSALTLAEPLKQIKGSIIKDKYKDRYKKNGGSCGDEISVELREYVVVLVQGCSRVSLERLREVAEKNEVWKDSYAVLNPGQQRMTIGNRLRAKHANGERIDIGGAIFEKQFKDL